MYVPTYSYRPRANEEKPRKHMTYHTGKFSSKEIIYFRVIFYFFSFQLCFTNTKHIPSIQLTIGDIQKRFTSSALTGEKGTISRCRLISIRIPLHAYMVISERPSTSLSTCRRQHWRASRLELPLPCPPSLLSIRSVMPLTSLPTLDIN